MLTRARLTVRLCLRSLALLCCLGVVGCALLDVSSGGFRLTHVSRSVKNSLPDIPTSPDAMTLEIVFIERPENDPLLGDVLWNEVDQVSSFKASTQQMLKANGFKVGHVSSVPPTALATLLGMQSRIEGVNSDHDTGQLVGRKIVLQSHVPTDIQVSRPIEKMMCQIPDSDSKLMEEKSFESARCVFRVTTERVQDGWAKIEFVPKIHHGEAKMRPTATQTEGWMFQSGQKKVEFYPQRFGLTLNVGEMVVISSEGDSDNFLGHYFFDGEGETEGIQRLLVVRLGDMRKTELVYTE